jgi:hypothetical protein
MSQSNVIARPSGTAWGAVLGGWIASVGAAALLAPPIAGLLAGTRATPNDVTVAVPVILGLLMAYLVGGYVAGRMAGYSTSWHGMMTAFFGLFVILLVLLVGAAAESGVFAASGIRNLAEAFPGVQGLDLNTFGDAVTFGAILGFLATIFAGWLGGLLAPDHYARIVRTQAAPVGTAAPGRYAEPVAERRGFRLLPSPGRKGGERVERVERAERTGPAGEQEVRESQVERR